MKMNNALSGPKMKLSYLREQEGLIGHIPTAL